MEAIMVLCLYFIVGTVIAGGYAKMSWSDPKTESDELIKVIVLSLVLWPFVVFVVGGEYITEYLDKLRFKSKGTK
jgi:hypothetical protein